MAPENSVELSGGRIFFFDTLCAFYEARSIGVKVRRYCKLKFRTEIQTTPDLNNRLPFVLVMIIGTYHS